jgi:site-specific recombinase XerD
MKGSEPARGFLRSEEGRRAERVVRRFHRWLDAKDLAVTSIAPADVERFLQVPFRKMVTVRTSQQYKRALMVYLLWLDDHGMLDFNPRQIGAYSRSPLPPSAETFLRSLEPTHRASTCGGYRTNLQQFHRWLDDARVRLRRLKREHVELWLLSLSDRKLSAATRTHAIQHVRAYLRWLAERGEVQRDPDDLVRGRDLPRLPSYLPRPLPPDIDRELQARLGRSLHPWWQGLLLMRLTGLRIGELRMLEYHCVRTDPGGHAFLKVPLGKLHNERLVPLSPQSLAIIHCLQQSPPLGRPYLLVRLNGSMVRYDELTCHLKRACEGLETPEPITSHRLRHTYATSLLNAGMSLVSVMKLLGHRDYRMTLRYTAITQETVGREYFDALEQLESRYAQLRTAACDDDFDPVKALDEVARWAKGAIGRDGQALVKRIGRVRDSIARRTNQPPEDG